MNKTRRSPLVHLLLCLGVAAVTAQSTAAQSTQQPESDLEFVNRLSAMAEFLAGRLDNLYAITGYQRSGRSARNTGGTGYGVDRSTDPYGSSDSRYGSATGRMHGNAFVTENDLNRANRKLVTIDRKLRKQRESLESGDNLTEKQLAKRDKQLQDLDRDLESLDRQISDMEKQLR